MIRLLRHSPLLALALLLATPAFGGAWLQAGHPCPVDSPWLSDHDGEHGGHDSEAAGGCHCVGSCAGSTAAALAAAPVFPPAAMPAPSVAPRLVPGAPAPAARPSDRLPPSTAPPLA